ncbi:tyrosine recombinase XerS [Lactobacillus sp. PSON]|uniref:tyrosine recombinase XerS n=1 Tax=Lactobacillus sp. PSON TaxID=3455454 RepID=UPI0040419F1E
MQIKEMSQKQITKRLSELPDFVRNFYDSHKIDTQPTTNAMYLLEINSFFTWLRTHTNPDYTEPLSAALSNKDITIDTLVKLDTMDINNYIYSLSTTETFYGTLPTTGTINHTISALKSFFRYLCEESEVGPLRKPYLPYNPMSKIKMKKDTATLNYRHKKIESQLFVGREQDLLAFIDEYYEKIIKTPQAKSKFKRDKERDLAIIALLLASGLRVSELVSLNLKNLKLTDTHGQVSMIRKGNHADTVGIVPWSIPYLEQYLGIRSKRYNASDDEKALFVTPIKGKATRLTTRSIQRMVKKYTQAYGRPSTPHKFRHTLGTELYEQNKDIVAVSEQLGQTSTSATDLYTHLGENKLHNDLSHIGEKQVDVKYLKNK